MGYIELILFVIIKRQMGRSRYKVLNEAYPYFHTVTVAGWQPIFTRKESVQILFDSFI